MSGYFEKGAWIDDSDPPGIFIRRPPASNENLVQLTNLIGKKAHRTKPCVCWQGYRDGSYSTEVVRILDVNDSHILLEWVWDGSFRKTTLNSDWIDGNWVEYPAGWP